MQLAELLGEKYPNYQWEKMVLLKGRYAEQKRLEKAVQILFPVGYFLGFYFAYGVFVRYRM